MRPHRDSTPILLVCVSLLFVLVAVLKVRDVASGETPARRWAPEPQGEDFESLALAALDEAAANLAPRFNQPGDAVFTAFRSLPEEGQRAVSLSVPVTSVARADQGVGLRARCVQAEVLPGPAFLAGDLPHAGVLRLEATLLHRAEPIWRSVREREYRLVRLGLPHPLGEHSLLVLDPSGFFDGGDDGELTRALEDQDSGFENLRDLRLARLRLLEQAGEVAGRLAEFHRSFRHLGGSDLEPPEAISAGWVEALEALPEDPADRRSMYHPEQALGTGWQTTDLTYWGGFLRWAERLRKARGEARQEYHQAWTRWGQVVGAAFDPARWGQLRAGAALDRQVAEDRARIARVLREVTQAAALWAGYEVQLLQHYSRPFEFFQPLEGGAYLRLAEAMRRLQPQAWEAQASKRYVGADAAARCGRFLEGISGPFAKDFRDVVFVDNAGGPALELAEATFPGRLVLVATGDVRLSNLGPRDSSRNRLLVQAGGRLEVSGRVRAFLVAQGGLRMQPDSQVIGGLVVTTLGPEDVLAGRVDWDPEARLEDQLEDLEVVLSEAPEE